MKLRRKDRRGVLLLVVLIMLVIFTLIAVAFIVTSSHHEANSRRGANASLRGDPAWLLLDKAAYDLIRDTTNPNSVIQGSSLLRKMYGDEGLRVKTPSTSPIIPRAGGQFLEFVIVPPTDVFLPQDLGVFNGRVLTFLNGPSKNLSTRIVASVPDSTGSSALIRVMASGLSPDGVRATDEPNTRMLINGQPFNGTGAGYNPMTGRLDLKHPTNLFQPEVALLPNPVRMRKDGLSGADIWGTGGVDDSYDLADYQNLAIAFVPEEPSENDFARMIIPSFYRPALLNYWLLRADLQANTPGMNSLFTNTNDFYLRQLRQMVETRPSANLNPEFPSLLNPTDPTDLSRLLRGPWDVDNDGDGIRDSVWIDLGYPVQQDADGRSYKPMFAILCVDMDGKFNINAHGSLDQLVQLYWTKTRMTNIPTPLADPSPPVWGGSTGDQLTAAPGIGNPYPIWSQPLAGGFSLNNLVINYGEAVRPGQGYGPPEVNLTRLFDQSLQLPMNLIGKYARLLVGGPDSITGKWLPGRYGTDQPYGPMNYYPKPGYISVGGDLQILNHLGVAFGNLASGDPPGHLPGSFFWDGVGVKPSWAYSSYGSPPDLLARMAMGLDFRGQPVYQRIDYSHLLPNAIDVDRFNSPYELNLMRNAARGAFDPRTVPADAPFTAAELERVLRLHDSDAGALPPRLWDLFRDTTSNGGMTLGPDGDLDGFHPFNPAENPSNPQLAEANRRQVTTDSYDLPVPNLTAWRELLLSTLGTANLPEGGLASVAQILRLRILQQIPGASDTVIRQQTALMLPPDLVLGVRMNLNRPFGDGVDFNGNGVVDEPLPAEVDGIFYNTPSGLIPLPGFSYTDGAIGVPDNSLAGRQLMARYLYVLAMLVKDTDAVLNQDGDPINDQYETARELAQWAVNVVDFRDADSIMTPFEFDPTPFDGWQVDGDLSTSTDPLASTDLFIDLDGDGIGDPGANYNLVDTNGDGMLDSPPPLVVWGAERPELLITETLAWHDRRTEDTADETEDENGMPITGATTSAGMPPDSDFDQRLRPRGALFIELYNPWTATNERPAEFYALPNQVPATWDPGLRLNQVTPGARPSPVWRMIIVHEPNPDLPRDPDDPIPNLRPAQEDIERSIYFADATPIAGAVEPTDPAAHVGEHQRYAVADLTNPAIEPLQPGRYAIVGTAGFNAAQAGTANPAIPLGMTEPSPGVPPMVNQLLNATRRIEFTANSITVFNDDTGTIADDIVPVTKPIVGVPIRGLNVSEPIPGSGEEYPIETILPGDYEGAYSPPLDEPLDIARVTAAADSRWNALNEDGMAVAFRRVHLQRLANPLLTWDPVLNPYLTVDSSRIDLTTFNGADNSATDEPLISDGDMEFSTVQRGEQDDLLTNKTESRVLWRQVDTTSTARSPMDRPEVPAVGATHYSAIPLIHSLGGLNRESAELGRPYYGAPFTAIKQPALFPDDVYASLPADYIGDPDSSDPNLYGQPFPWFTWLNRPFVNQMELMLVPRGRSSRLLVADDPADVGPRFRLSGTDPAYLIPMSAPTTARFNHLANFFQTSDVFDILPQGRPALNLYRLLDLTHVPSRFVGTETILDPVQLSVSSDLSYGGEDFPQYLRPPFNRVSQFREPGKVNVNSITSRRVWQALLGQSAWTPWDDFLKSRRGYESGSPPIATLGDPGVPGVRLPAPTFFANPVRSPGAGELVPLTGTPLRDRSNTPIPGVYNPDLRRADIDVTLLRSSGADLPDPTIPGNINEPLSEPLLAQRPSAAAPYNDGDRNPYFRYQQMTRLGSTTTTRSNVYAIWITMGYFEVEAPPLLYGAEAALLYPTGYQLGRELGSDLGQVRRHKAFYMLDRSIPVGYEPGENHNVDQAIILRRFIE